MEKMLMFAALGMFCAMTALGREPLKTDTFKTSEGDFAITFIGHGSLMFSFAGKIIHVDPYSALADYGKLPKADLVLITHEHGDHLDPKALGLVRKPDTKVALTEAASKTVEGGAVMKNGDALTMDGVRIEAVPAYNIVNKRPGGGPFHPRGVGNGYVLAFGGTKVYIAGDTENIPEMRALTNIDIAFLPMNLPYTMTPEMTAEAAGMFHPRILYPYHYGETDPGKLVDLLKAEKGIEVRIRDMK